MLVQLKKKVRKMIQFILNILFMYFCSSSNSLYSNKCYRSDIFMMSLKDRILFYAYKLIESIFNNSQR